MLNINVGWQEINFLQIASDLKSMMREYSASNTKSLGG